MITASDMKGVVMYCRKTANGYELSEARRQAAFARKNRRGGRPKGWRKDPDASPPQTVAVDPLDLVVLRKYGALRGMTLKGVLHLLAAALVFGSNIPARAELKPDVWKFRRQ